MAYVLVKRGKFMEGHGYATGIGYSFTWTRDESRAKRFADNDPPDLFMNITGAHAERRANNRAELRAIGRERIELRNAAHKIPSIHDRINRRASRSNQISQVKP
jgi:hypothetical protein